MHAKIFIATPTYDERVTRHYTSGLVSLCFTLQARGIEYMYSFVGRAVVQQARNELTAQFLATDCSHLLFVDSDQVFRAEDVIGMLNADKPVIFASCPRRDGTAYPLHLDEAVVNADESISPDDDCVPVICGGAGLMLIQRHVIEAVIENEARKVTRARDALQRLVEQAGTTEARELGETVGAQLGEGIAYVNDYGQPRHALFEFAARDGLYWSEDCFWCRRVREAGGSVWLYRPGQLGHVDGTRVLFYEAAKRAAAGD